MPINCLWNPTRESAEKKQKERQKGHKNTLQHFDAIMVQFTIFKGSKGGKIVQSNTTKDLKENDVLIKVTHSGVCGTDSHMRTIDMALGHEGAGVVEVSSSRALLEHELIKV